MWCDSLSFFTGLKLDGLDDGVLVLFDDNYTWFPAERRAGTFESKS